MVACQSHSDVSLVLVLVLEGVGGGRPQCVHADRDAELLRLAVDELVDPSPTVERTRAVVADGPEEGGPPVVDMAGGLSDIR